MRTYTTGISLSHIPLSERGNMKKKLAAIVNQLSDENTRLNVNTFGSKGALAIESMADDTSCMPEKYLQLI